MIPGRQYAAPYTHDTTHNGGITDGFVSRLDPSKSGSAQLLYSTFLGGSGYEFFTALSVDARAVVTVTGNTQSSNFPTTRGAYDKTYKGPADAFVSRLIPQAIGSAGLVYSTFLGGSGGDQANAIFVDTGGEVTLAGVTDSSDFPTTSGAHDTTYNGGNGGDAFVSRLDPSRTGAAQLVYSTFLGGGGSDTAGAFSVDASRVVTVVGVTFSSNYPATNSAYDRTYNGLIDAFVSRLDMDMALYGDVHRISLSTGGTQKLTVNAGKPQANRSYWVLGSVTGTSPGVTLASAIGSVKIPLNPDIWTDFTIAFANTATLTNTKAKLDGSGTAQASFTLPRVNLPSAIGLVFYHAYLVYDQKNNFYMASNPVPLKLVK